MPFGRSAWGDAGHPPSRLKRLVLNRGFITFWRCSVLGGMPSASASDREILSRCTPRKVTMKPARRENVLVPEVVLKPWKRIKEATIVAVEKQT